MRALAIIVVLLAGCDKKFNEEYCINHGDDPAYAQYCHPDANTIDAKIPDGPPNTYRVLFSVTGLSGTVVLQNNGRDDKPVSADGPYYFDMTLLTGTMYDVAVKTQPATQTCTVASGMGTVMDADVMGIIVTCAGDPGIKCGTTYCAIGDTCCFPTQVCNSVTACSTTAKLACDDTADCAAVVGSICCGRLNGGGNAVKDSVCLQLSDCMANMGGYEILCDPNAPGGDPACDATTGPTCAGANKFTGYNRCQ